MALKEWHSGLLTQRVPSWGGNPVQVTSLVTCSVLFPLCLGVCLSLQKRLSQSRGQGWGLHGSPLVLKRGTVTWCQILHFRTGTNKENLTVESKHSIQKVAFNVPCM